MVPIGKTQISVLEFEGWDLAQVRGCPSYIVLGLTLETSLGPPHQVHMGTKRFAFDNYSIGIHTIDKRTGQ